MKNFFFLFLLAGIGLTAGAQSSNFLLYSFKGNVSVVENNTESKAKVGKLLNSSASVKLASGSAVTLICNEAAMFTITKSGTFSLKNFGDSCRINSSSVSANYIKYVWAQMTEHSEAPGSNRRAFMNTVGAVSRSINNIWIDPKLDTLNYSSGEFPLSWKSYADAKDFDFTIYNSSNVTEPIFKTTVGKLKIPVTSFTAKLKPGTSYLWTAAVKGEENDEMKVFNYVSAATFNQVLADIKKQVTAGEGSAEEAYRTAFMLEDAHYLSEAYQYYSKAATLDPTNVLYRSTLMSFKKDYEIK